MRKDIRLNNVLFPFWMLILFPPMWLLILPGNLIIDSLVLLVCMKVLKIEQRFNFYKSTILKIFCIGMFSDIIGSAYMFMMMVGFEIGNMGDELYLTLPALFISAILIFVLNYFISFRKCEKLIRLKMSLTFAIATAPYTFLVPSSWWYG